jgi:hypothetical protein
MGACWEYCVVQLSGDEAQEESTLSALGKEGYDLVAVVPAAPLHGSRRAYLKRQTSEIRELRVGIVGEGSDA